MLIVCPAERYNVCIRLGMFEAAIRVCVLFCSVVLCFVAMTLIVAVVQTLIEFKTYERLLPLADTIFERLGLSLMSVVLVDVFSLC